MALKDLQWLLRNGRIRLTATPTLYHCEPIWSWKVDSMPDYGLVLTLGGRGEIAIDGETQSLRAGVCLFIRPTSRIEAQQDPLYPLFLFVARFDIVGGSQAPIAASSLSLPANGIFIRNTKHIESLAEIIVGRSGEEMREDSLEQDAINMLFRLLVEDASKQNGYFDARAFEALQAIELDLARKWTVAELAIKADMPPRAFARSFARMMGEPPIQYLVRRRMDEARVQILQSSLPIEEIAINLGYDDLRFFRALFKSRAGATPESLRRGRAL